MSSCKQKFQKKPVIVPIVTPIDQKAVVRKISERRR